MFFNFLFNLEQSISRSIDVIPMNKVNNNEIMPVDIIFIIGCV